MGSNDRLAGKKALVVDDSESVRQALRGILEGAGLEVHEAANGAAALQWLRSRKADVVLLDLQMPVMDGPTLLRFLRLGGDQTRVVLLTSTIERKALAPAMKLGVSDYVAKPFDAVSVEAALGRVFPPAVEPKADEPG